MLPSPLMPSREPTAACACGRPSSPVFLPVSSRAWRLAVARAQSNRRTHKAPVARARLPIVVVSRAHELRRLKHACGRYRVVSRHRARRAEGGEPAVRDANCHEPTRECQSSRLPPAFRRTSLPPSSVAPLARLPSHLPSRLPPAFRHASLPPSVTLPSRLPSLPSHLCTSVAPPPNLPCACPCTPARLPDIPAHRAVAAVAHARARSRLAASRGASKPPDCLHRPGALVAVVAQVAR